MWSLVVSILVSQFNMEMTASKVQLDSFCSGCKKVRLTGCVILNCRNHSLCDHCITAQLSLHPDAKESSRSNQCVVCPVPKEGFGRYLQFRVDAEREFAMHRDQQFGIDYTPSGKIAMCQTLNFSGQKCSRLVPSEFKTLHDQYQCVQYACRDCEIALTTHDHADRMELELQNSQAEIARHRQSMLQMQLYCHELSDIFQSVLHIDAHELEILDPCSKLTKLLNDIADNSESKADLLHVPTALRKQTQLLIHEFSRQINCLQKNHNINDEVLHRLHSDIEQIRSVRHDSQLLLVKVIEVRSKWTLLSVLFKHAKPDNRTVHYADNLTAFMRTLEGLQMHRRQL